MMQLAVNMANATLQYTGALGPTCVAGVGQTPHSAGASAPVFPRHGPHVIFLFSPTLRTPQRVNDMKAWKCCNLILYSNFNIFLKHSVRGASSSGVAAGRSVSKQKGPL
jgi:hypothetical protein